MTNCSSRYFLLSAAVVTLAVAPAAPGQILDLLSQTRLISGSASVDGFDTESFSVSAPDFGEFSEFEAVLVPPVDLAPNSASADALQFSSMDELSPDEASIFALGEAYADIFLDDPLSGSSSAASVFDVGFRVTQQSFFDLYGEAYEDVVDVGVSGSTLVQLLEDGVPLFTLSGSAPFDVSGTLYPGKDYRLIGRAEAAAAATGPIGNYAFTGFDVSLDLVAVPEPAACAAAAGAALVGFGLWRRRRPAR